MKKKSSLLVTAAALAVLAAALPARAGQHTWSGAYNGYWANPLNWSSGGVPQPNESNVSLVFPVNATRFWSTNDMAGISVKSINFQADNYHLLGYGLSFLNNGIGLSLLCSGANCEIQMPVELTAPALGFTVGATGDLMISGFISGPGGFSKYGPGTLRINGAPGNTFAGATTVADGALILKTQATWDNDRSAALGGALNIGSADMTRHPIVYFDNSDQLDPNAPVTIQPNGLLDLHGYDGAVGPVSLTGGSIHLSGLTYYDSYTAIRRGSLVISQTLTSAPSALASSSITGGATFLLGTSNAPNTVVHVAAGGDLLVEGDFGCGTPPYDPYTRGVNWNKTGTGNLTLTGTGSDAETSGRGNIKEGTVTAASSAVHFRDLVSVETGAQLIINAAIESYGPIRLNGYGTNGFDAALRIIHDGAHLNGNLTVESDSAIVVANPNDSCALGMAGSLVSGSAQLTKRGPGRLQLLDVTNLMTGPLVVDLGVLEVHGTVSPALGSGPVQVGRPSADGSSAQLKWLASNQHGVGGSLKVLATGFVNLNGYNQTESALTLSGGSIQTYGGLLQLAGDVLVTNAVASAVSGQLSLGAGQRGFHVASGSTLAIFAAISDVGPTGAGFDLDGGGTLALYGANSYLGDVQVKAGLLYARHDGALGSITGGTKVWSGARLASDGHNFGGEAITLNGDGDGYGALTGSRTNIFTGPITLASDAVINVPGVTDRVILGGVVSGPGGFDKIGAGTLQLNGAQANVYAGLTSIEEGVLELGKASVLAIPGALTIGNDVDPAGTCTVKTLQGSQMLGTAHVNVGKSGAIDFSPAFLSSHAMGSLTGWGPINLGFGSLTVGADNLDGSYFGRVTGFGAANLIKVGTGKWVLGGTSDQYVGSTVINGGVIHIQSWNELSPVQLNAGGTLMGEGRVGTVKANGGRMRPGSPPVFQTMKSKDLTLDAASTFEARLAGTNAGVSYAQLTVEGGVNLGNASLNLVLSFNAGLSNQFVIVLNDGNDPVVGTFKNLPEGGVATFGGAKFQITYHGGDGNDIAVTQISLAAPPKAGTVTKKPDGSIEVTGTGLPDAGYIVEACSDLAIGMWYQIAYATADSSGAISFTDQAAPNYRERFYRFIAK